MAQIKNILLRIVATFAASGLGVIGAGTIAGVPLWKAIFMAGIAGVATVIEGLSRAFLDDGKLSLDEIDRVFSKVEKKKEATPPPSQAVQGNNAIDRDKQKEKKRLQRQFDELEAKIAVLKKSKSEAEAALADPAIYSNRTAFSEAESTYNRLQTELINSEKQSETVFEALMNLE